MAVTTDNVVNENYDPGDREEQILELLKEGRDDGEPWGRVNPKYVTEHTGIRRQYVSRALGNLETAGWVTKVATGLYELVADPRDE
jgi:DNA-binding IclR family transcriptional regulator